MKNIKNYFKRHQMLAIIIIALFFGLLGGIVGEIFSRAYLYDAPYNFPNGKYTEQGLVITNPKNVIVEQDVKADETIKAVGNSLVGIYKKQKPVEAGDEFALENFYKIGSAAGQGFIITSDGWIVTSLNLDKTFADYVVITKDKKIYPIDKAARDNLTEFSFVHVAARDFPVRKFAEKQNVNQGNLVLSVNRSGLSLISYVAGLSEPGGLIKPSDSFSGKLILRDKPSPEFKGSVIFNLAGDAVGLIDNSGEIEPINHLAGAVKNLFKNKTADRPSLGLSYLDLSGLAQIEGQNSNWQKGAIIYGDAKNAAVKKNGPADKAGLLLGDIIISVNNVNLDKGNDLAETIQNYAAGDKVNLVFLRAGKENKVEVTLGELK